MMNGGVLFALLTAIFTLAAVPAYSAPLEFDCDVPADRFSSVSQDVANGGSVSGTIRVDQLRKGKNLPVVGAGIFSPEKRAISGFQLVASDTRARSFDIMFNVAQESGVKRERSVRSTHHLP